VTVQQALRFRSCSLQKQAKPPGFLQVQSGGLVKLRNDAQLQLARIV
jgi:hypothetical protein